MSAHGERVTSGTPDDLAAVGDQLARKTEEIRIIQQVSSEINATLDLGAILEITLKAMDAAPGFNHGMILLADVAGEKLVLAASRGYEDAGIGAEVGVGQGIIGVVAKRRRIMRMGNIQAQLTYLTAVPSQVEGASVRPTAKIVLR